MKKVLAIIIGVVIGFTIIFIGDSVTLRFYSEPLSLKLLDGESLSVYLASVPLYITIITLLFWILSAFLGGLVAARLHRSNWKKTAVITGSILLAATILKMIMMPQPMWMVISAIVVFIPIAYLGGRLVRPKPVI